MTGEVDLRDRLKSLLASSSPERFRVWSEGGELDLRISDAISALGEKQIPIEEAENQAFSRLAAGDLFHEFPLGFNQTEWASRLHAAFRATSPESYAVADAAGRAEPNVAALVRRATREWTALVQAGAPIDQMSRMQLRLLSQSGSLNRPVMVLTDARPAVDATPPQQISSSFLSKLPDFFILGPERSGTTVFGAALSTSSDIFVLNDTMVLLRWVSMAFQIDQSRRVAARHGMSAGLTPDLPLTLDTPAHLGHVKWLLSMLGSTYYGAGTHDAEPNKNLARFALHGDLLDFEGALAVSRQGGTWREVMQKIYGSLIPERYSNRPIIGEKTPANIVEHELLRRHFPEARLICVVRRPDANLASIYLRYPSDRLEHALEHYGKFCDAALSLKNSCADVLFVRYEDFVNDAQLTIDRVASMLGCPTWAFNGAVASYNMPEYIGTSVSLKRSRNIIDIGVKERELIEQRCCEFIDAFYSDSW
jgi:hypothetical protein